MFVESGDDESEADAEEEFRLYSCLLNDVKTHCVEFEDEAKGKNEGFVKLPMYLRPAIDLLINSYPKGQTVRALVAKCSEHSVVTLPEIQEFVKLLHEMQLIKLTI